MPDSRPVVTARGAAVTLGAIAAIIAALQLLQLALPSIWIDESAPFKLEGKSLPSTLVDIALLPALGEEILFRGVILSGLLGVFGKRTAAIVSALMFASLHLSPLSFLHLAALGYILARTRLATASLWPCIAIHAAYNAALVVIGW